MTSTTSAISATALVSAGIVSAQDQSAREQDLRGLAARLGSVAEQPRKLLTHIVELAYETEGRQHQQDRQPHTAYLPELHESCGLDVDAMYQLLAQLHAARLVVLEKQYPFEDVRVAAEASGWNALEAIWHYSKRNRVPLRDLLVDLRFDRMR
jgi:hypothetical protein